MTIKDSVRELCRKLRGEFGRAPGDMWSLWNFWGVFPRDSNILYDEVVQINIDLLFLILSLSVYTIIIPEAEPLLATRTRGCTCKPLLKITGRSQKPDCM